VRWSAWLIVSEEIEYLDLDDLMAAADVAIGGSPEVRDCGLLESALARPRASVFGEDAYPSLNEKAAALLHSLVSARPPARSHSVPVSYDGRGRG
jgi:death-on-curing protein